jgi:uncharacterized protein
MRVLCDTSGLFAALARNDQHHDAARALLERLLLDDHELHLTSYGLIELTALLQARIGLVAARAFEHDLRPLLKVTWVDASLHAKVFALLEQRSRKLLSLVDCTNFVLMRQLGIELAFSFDEDFSIEGFRLLREPSDLVTG